MTSGPSGRTLTAAERRALGRTRVEAWLSKEASRALAKLTKDGTSKTAAIEAALITVAAFVAGAKASTP